MYQSANQRTRQNNNDAFVVGNDHTPARGRQMNVVNSRPEILTAICRSHGERREGDDLQMFANVPGHNCDAPYANRISRASMAHGQKKAGTARAIPAMISAAAYALIFISYSRFVVLPGIGTGYFPSASATIGGGESIVHLSQSGANSCSQLSMSS